MARRLPEHLSRKSALVLLPPATISAPIEAVRRVHDKQFHRWPPHINLLYPFLSSPSEQILPNDASAPKLKQEIRMRIENATRNIKPFDISLSADPPGSFYHNKKNKTVWLGPTTRLVHKLQAALQAEFFGFDQGHRPFKPHLSVGQERITDGTATLEADITKSVSEFVSKNSIGSAPVALDWHVDRVHVIQREGYKDRFKIIGTIELGTA